MNVPEDLRYTATHEWVRVVGEVVQVGITDHAQGELGDIVFVERPPVGDAFEKGEEVATIESVKAASPIYCPVSGKVVATNAELEKAPERINQDPYAAYVFTLKPSDPGQLAGLLDAVAYRTLVEQEEKTH